MNLTNSKQRKLRLTALYIRSHGLATFLIGCPVIGFQVAGGFSLVFVWYKVLTSIGYAYSLTVYNKPEMVFYQNFGLSIRFLSASLVLFDFLIWLLLVYGIYLGSR